MKFDVVIGNPPYQTLRKSETDSDKSLWLQFVNIGMKLLNAGGNLVFITPPSFLSSTGISVRLFGSVET